MITLNQEKQKLTLKASFKGSTINELVVQKDGKTTLISQDATVYAYFDQEKLDWKKIKSFLTDFTKTNTYNINIDIDSFTQKECCIKVAIETLLYWTHKPLSYKTKNEDNESIKFNILSSNKNVEPILIEALITSFHINATKDLQDAAPNFMYPDSFAKEIQRLAKDVSNAEGRLVLADVMTCAIRKFNVTKLIEASTLTGAILSTLGQYMSGVFANDDEFYKEFNQAAINACKEVWRLPIHKQNYDYMKSSKVADLTNSETGYYGASSNAAAFLNEFAEEKQFIHLDICGTSGMLTSEKRGVM